ncbi:hypothetical protein VTN77DRAFT_4623 [Rasamsonia byssochlamydoides]|uniref:uncharacterized protein n=1 Tax=Rasamsonia byssochlamydoides TaxID=89139 RepID=UPI003742E19F
MSSKYPTDLLPIDPESICVNREIRRSNASSIFEIEINGTCYAMKVFHDNGDPGFSKKGRVLNRFRCELQAYRNLRLFGVCERGFVPRYYGYIDRLDPTKLQPHLDHFRNDQHNPRAIFLEYFPDAEKLNCVNYSDQRFQKAINGIKEIHNALIHHHDICPKKISFLCLENQKGYYG